MEVFAPARVAELRGGERPSLRLLFAARSDIRGSWRSLASRHGPTLEHVRGQTDRGSVGDRRIGLLVAWVAAEHVGCAAGTGRNELVGVLTERALSGRAGCLAVFRDTEPDPAATQAQEALGRAESRCP